MTPPRRNIDESKWKVNARLIRVYLLLKAEKLIPDPVKRDDLWEAFTNYIGDRRQDATKAYVKFRDGDDMARAEVVDAWLEKQRV